jgi:hypothetical protein
MKTIRSLCPGYAAALAIFAGFLSSCSSLEQPASATSKIQPSSAQPILYEQASNKSATAKSINETSPVENNNPADIPGGGDPGWGPLPLHIP